MDPPWLNGHVTLVMAVPWGHPWLESDCVSANLATVSPRNTHNAGQALPSTPQEKMDYPANHWLKGTGLPAEAAADQRLNGGGQLH